MDYQDFVLQLDRAPQGQGFVTRVIRSLAGEAEAPFVNPVSAAEIESLWQAGLAARQVERAARVRDARPAGFSRPDPLAAELSLEELGHRLFTALFRGPVRSCWMRSLTEATRSPEGGLRLKLQLNLEDPALVPLAELPWEYLFSLEHGGFLGLQRKTPILRHMRLPLPTGQAPVAKPLRVLLVSAQPRSMSQLSLAEEGETIAAALRALPGVEILPLQDPTIETLRETLLQRNFHVLHFMGHGGFDAASGQGVLYFTDRIGAPVPVSGSILASHLADLPSLRLVFLNACETARVNARAPFAGVAMALLRAGLPAVVAMQRPIRDGSALELSRTVYRRLAAGDPIDAAVTEGRLAIAREHGALLEWGTPVLFSRADDGTLFAREPAEVPAPVFVEAPIVPRSTRSQRSLYLATVVVIAVLGFAVAQWRLGLEAHQEPSPKDPSRTEQLSPLTTDMTDAPNPVVPGKEDKKEQSKEEQRVLKPQIDERKEPEEPALVDPPSHRPKSGPPEVSEGSPASFPDLEAEVGADFFEEDGYSFARFWVTPQGQGTLQQPPVMGPGAIAFLTPKGGTYHLDVLSLNLAEKRATVRLRFAS
jgi:hypothetical protein